MPFKSLIKARFCQIKVIFPFFIDLTHLRRGGRVVMQGTATPRTAVRFRSVPPNGIFAYRGILSLGTQK